MEVKVKAVDKLIDLLGSGISGLFAPWQEVRVGKARTTAKIHEILAITQAEKSVEAIRNGTHFYDSDSAKLIEYSGVTGLSDERNVQGEETEFLPLRSLKRLGSNVIENELRKEINVAKSITFAYEELAEEDPDASANPIEDDWLNRWRTGASEVSDDEMQALWGKVLAGELKDNGTYSYRTIEYLKTLSKVDAHKVKELAGYVWEGDYIPFETKFFEENVHNFAYFLEFEETNILLGVSSGGLQYSKLVNIGESEAQIIICSNNMVLDIKAEGDSKPITFKCYKLSNVGRELVKLANQPTLLEYAVSYAEFLGPRVKALTLGEIVKRDGNITSYKKLKKIK